jgi:hypothetical protein
MAEELSLGMVVGVLCMSLRQCTTVFDVKRQVHTIQREHGCQH